MTSATTSLDAIVRAVGQQWPAHLRTIEKAHAALSPPVFAVVERVSALILLLAGDGLSRVAADYRATCEALLAEELYFRRNDRYRARSAAEAHAIVAEDPDFAARYFNGLMLSHVLWTNHANALAQLVEHIASAPTGSNVVEIGPGHGMISALCAQRDNVRMVMACDIDPAALSSTRRVVELAGVADKVAVVDWSLLSQELPPQAPREGFDVAILYEVLEHLDEPLSALRSLARHIRTGGQLLLSVPINSPAPDHVALFRTADEIEALASQAGFSIVAAAEFGMGGVDLEKARRAALTITYAGVWQRI